MGYFMSACAVNMYTPQLTISNSREGRGLTVRVNALAACPLHLGCPTIEIPLTKGAEAALLAPLRRSGH